MEGNHDVLVKIAEKIEGRDLLSLRLVNRDFRFAVEEASIEVSISTEIEPEQLKEVGRAFRNATSLDFSDCLKLTDASLTELQSLFPKVANLYFVKCAWMTDAAALCSLSRLVCLQLSGCSSLTALPEAISALPLLQVNSAHSPC